MLELLATWGNLVVLALSSVAAFLSVVYARKSVKAGRSSQQIAKQQAQLNFAEMVQGWQPRVTIELSKVEYRWSDNRFVLGKEGGASNPGVTNSESMSIDAADKNGVRVEIVMQGHLTNKTSEQMLITIRRMKRGGWKPLENECLFLVDEADQGSFILAPGSTVKFTWVDRKSLSAWRAIYHATNTDASTADPTFKRPLESRTLRQRILRKRSTDALEWDAQERHHAGFDVVAESRMDTRVATIWRFEPGRSAVVPDANGGISDKRSWKLQAKAECPIDDEVIKYRCYYNSALAQIDTPSIIHLPGRH